MKKSAAFLLTLLMAISLVACGGDSETAQPDETESTGPAPEMDTGAEGIKVLVAYFSATNTTEGVAELIADGLNAELYEIVPEEPYTDADLNYNDNNSRTTIEIPPGAAVSVPAQLIWRS